MRAPIDTDLPLTYSAAAARRRTDRTTFLTLPFVAQFYVVSVTLLGAGGAVRFVRQRREAARRPAVIHLDVKPSGAVYDHG